MGGFITLAERVRKSLLALSSSREANASFKERCIGRAVGERGHDPGPIGLANATAEDEPLLSGPMGRQPVRSARRVSVSVCERPSTHRAGHASRQRRGYRSSTASYSTRHPQNRELRLLGCCSHSGSPILAAASKLHRAKITRHCTRRSDRRMARRFSKSVGEMT